MAPPSSAGTSLLDPLPLAGKWGERERDGAFTRKVFNGPGLGTTITPAHIPLASAQSHGHISARQTGKCSLVVPRRGGEGCEEHLASLLAGMHCAVGPAFTTVLGTGLTMTNYC